VYGKISSEWRYEGKTFVYKTSIPANTTATLYLPANSIAKVKEGGKSITQVKGISQVSLENNQVKMTLVSGSYQFEVK
jgi:alpha-L-rhamnosidase